MTIIKNWEPSANSKNWTDVLRDACELSGESELDMGDGRLFTLIRDLHPSEVLPLSDMETAIACDLDFGYRTIRVDQPLVLIVHHYLNSLY